MMVWSISSLQPANMGSHKGIGADGDWFTDFSELGLGPCLSSEFESTGTEQSLGIVPRDLL